MGAAGRLLGIAERLQKCLDDLDEMSEPDAKFAAIHVHTAILQIEKAVQRAVAGSGEASHH